MLFVQTEQVNDFEKDVKDKNPYMTTAALPLNNIESVNRDYEQLKALFLSIKEDVTYADINNYIGSKNAFFVDKDDMLLAVRSYLRRVGQARVSAT